MNLQIRFVTEGSLFIIVQYRIFAPAGVSSQQLLDITATQNIFYLLMDEKLSFQIFAGTTNWKHSLLSKTPNSSSSTSFIPLIQIFLIFQQRMFSFKMPQHIAETKLFKEYLQGPRFDLDCVGIILIIRYKT